MAQVDTQTAGGATAVAAPPQRRLLGRRRKAPLTGRAREERRLGYLLCAPAIAVMLLVTGYPIVYALILSLQRYDLRFPDDRSFVGLSNYKTVLTSSTWWTD